VDGGAVYAWGDNSSGQLGLGDQVTRQTPTLVPGLIAMNVVAGGAHSMAIRSDGGLLAWGARNGGQGRGWNHMVA
jgi:alpha-tubulin suppressor-like RCC1 family protein